MYKGFRAPIEADDIFFSMCDLAQGQGRGALRVFVFVKNVLGENRFVGAMCEEKLRLTSYKKMGGKKM